MNEENRRELLRALPGVDAFANSDRVQKYSTKISSKILTEIARDAVENTRAKILQDDFPGMNTQEVPSQVERVFLEQIEALLQPSLKKVINGTGVVLHTGLGRAVLSAAAADHTKTLLESYTNLEFDLVSGKRGDRTKHVDGLICRLTGAEAACVVNNNAAAVLIALNSLANRKEVVVSRGELVEIGGSFRIPDVMKKSGAKMVEVGTTNKTHLHDFENAVSSRTAAFLSVHTSNYRVQGFTAQVELGELTKLAHANEVAVIHDLGGGVFVDLAEFDLPQEPVVSDSIKAGCDVITFSGDKVLGGPQCGVIVGKSDFIKKIKKNPLMRALRCDKLTYALLEETLRLFLNPDNLPQHHVVLKMMTESSQNLEVRAENLLNQLGRVKPEIEISLERTFASAGSGALPLEKIPSFALIIRLTRKRSVSDLARKFRLSNPAVVGYVQNNRFCIDLRTIQPREDISLLKALKLHLC